MSYQTSSKMPLPFWLLIGARKLLCFPTQSEGSKPMSRFVCPYTEWYMKLSCSPCFSGLVAEALLEMKSSNLSTKCKGYRSDFRRESHRQTRWTFRRCHNSSLFESLWKYSPIHWCILDSRRYKLRLKKFSESLSTRWTWVWVALYSIVSSFSREGEGRITFFSKTLTSARDWNFSSRAKPRRPAPRNMASNWASCIIPCKDTRNDS